MRMKCLTDWISLCWCLGDESGWERNYGLFYMLLQRNNDLSEIGLNSVSDKMCRSAASQKIVVQNNFHLKPSPVVGQVTSVDLSCTHAAAVLSDNETVSTWGHGKSGALGILPPHCTTIPTLVTSIDCQIKQIACGAEFTLMMTQQGKVLSCGKGTFGKLGHGDEEDRKSPTLVRTKSLSRQKLFYAMLKVPLSLNESWYPRN